MVGFNTRVIAKLIDSQYYKDYTRQLNERWCKKNLKTMGHGAYIHDRHLIRNPKYMSLGNGFSAYYNLRLEAWDSFAGVSHKPELIIGNNLILNSDIHYKCHKQNKDR